MVAAQLGTKTERDGRSDFDFLVGTWRLHSRRLKERLQGCTDWEECGGTLVARTVLGGLGNLDEVTFERESGPHLGLTLRLHDPVSRQWSLYWADSVTGILQVPMIGEFTGGRGELRPGTLRGPSHLQPLHLVRDHRHLLSLGASLFGGRRPDLGDELGRGVHPDCLTPRRQLSWNTRADHLTSKSLMRPINETARRPERRPGSGRNGRKLDVHRLS